MLFNMNFPLDNGAKLKVLRKVINKITIKELAEKIQIPEAYLVRYERNYKIRDKHKVILENFLK